MESLAGEIGIELIHHNGCVRATRLHAARPFAARALTGKTPAQVLAAVPLLFALCGSGQAYAAYLACREALGYEADLAADQARELLVTTEALREHAWRILLDWPKLSGDIADQAVLAKLLKLDQQLNLQLFEKGRAFELDSRPYSNPSPGLVRKLLAELTGLIDTGIFGGQLAAFYRLDSEPGLKHWLVHDTSKPGLLLKRLYQFGWQACGQSRIRPLPDLGNAELEQVLKNTDLQVFCRLPHWHGVSFETTPYGRQCRHPLIQALREHYHNGLLVRLVATLLEVAQLSETLLNPGLPLALASGQAGVGISQVQAARGLLIHRVVFSEGLAQNYTIIAPTEWNFHPHGVVAESLMNLCAHSPAELKAQADLLIHVIDPCINYQLRLLDQPTAKVFQHA